MADRKAKSVQVKNVNESVRLTAEQREAIAKRAEQCGVRKNAWMRSILVQAAMRPARNGYLHIREPNGTET